MPTRTSSASHFALQCTMTSSAYRSNGRCFHFLRIHRSNASCRNKFASRGLITPRTQKITRLLGSSGRVRARRLRPIGNRTVPSEFFLFVSKSLAHSTNGQSHLKSPFVGLHAIVADGQSGGDLLGASVTAKSGKKQEREENPASQLHRSHTPFYQDRTKTLRRPHHNGHIAGRGRNLRPPRRAAHLDGN